MKILYSAFACNPYIGSETQCGWSWPMSMRNHNQVYVLTREENREPIERYLKENNIDNIEVFYFDIPQWMNVYYKTGKMYFPYYILWQHLVTGYVKKLNKKYRFDYIQHVTLGDFRIIGTLWKVDTKFVFGPVGGAQVTPKVFEEYTKSEIKSEKRRELINKIIVNNPFYKRAINKAHLVLSANKETQNFLQGKMKNPNKCKLLTENGIQREKIGTYKAKDTKETVTILWAGRLITRKGLVFLLEAVRLISTDHKFEVLIVGDGGQKEYLEELIDKWELKDVVKLLGKVDYQKMHEIYEKSDFFVFPSLRETTGTVLFEAMSQGLPVITFNQNGADLLIDDSCGIKVDINQSLDEIKDDFAKAMERLIGDAELRNKLGQSSYELILNEYTWDKKCQTFEEKFLNGNVCNEK